MCPTPSMTTPRSSPLQPSPCVSMLQRYPRTANAQGGRAVDRGASATMPHYAIICLTFIIIGFGAIATPSAAQEARDMALVGAHDLQGRSAYQPTIHLQSGRWIAYIGHHGGTQEIPKPLNALTGA